MFKFVNSILLLVSLLFASQSIAQNVDVKIVLALDASGSVDGTEFSLQIDGVTKAFRNSDVQRAILSGPNRSISAAVLIWSDADFSKFASKWHTLNSPQSFEDFASEIEAFKSTVLSGGGTGIGDALAHAITMLESNPARAPRSVIDISGDGPETKPWFQGVMQLPKARQIADRRGIIVNGLAIETEGQNLGEYYQDNVITGPGSFVLRARNFHAYQKAIIDKLLRELSPVPVSQYNFGKARFLAYHSAK